MAEGLFTFIAFAAGLVAFSLASRIFDHFGQKEWEQAAAQTKLEFSRGLMAGNKLHGKLRGFEVEVFETPSEDPRDEVVAKVHGVDPGFTMTPEGLLSKVMGDIETGDPDFDRQVRIKGDTELALALLSRRVRNAAARVVVDHGGEVSGQTIRVPMDRIGQAKSRLNLMLNLARLLRRPSSQEIPDLLARQALRDKSGVRLRAFRQLISSESRSQRVCSIAEELLSVRDPALRLEAAWLLLEVPGQSQAAVKAHAKLAAGRHFDPPIRISALKALAASQRLPDALPVMAEILHGPDEDGDVRRTALEGLIEARDAAELLAARPEGSAEAELLARGLGHLDAAAQPRLLELLEHPEDRVRAAAATSLGRVGELSAIPALHELAGTDFFKSGGKRAAAEAMEKIRSRSVVSQAGEISMVTVEPLEGAVSLEDEEEAGGEISLAP